MPVSIPFWLYPLKDAMVSLISWRHNRLQVSKKNSSIMTDRHKECNTNSPSWVFSIKHPPTALWVSFKAFSSRILDSDGGPIRVDALAGMQPACISETPIIFSWNVMAQTL